MGLVGWLNTRAELHALTARPEVRALANRVLGAVPVVRALPNGTRYRCRYIDSFTVADELFVQKVYDDALPETLETFCDLGANAGFFIARLRDRYPNARLRGLAIDANADLVQETRWLLQRNGVYDVLAVHGLVGDPKLAGTSGDFFLNPVGTNSSAFAEGEPNVPLKGKQRRMTVSYVDAEALWRGVHGDRDCDLLKCDIEGGERDFLRADNPFLRRVQAVVAEIHLWVISLDEIDGELRAAGFRKERALELTSTRSTVVYRR